LTFVSGITFPLRQPKRDTLFLKVLVCFYCPLPSFAFTRSSVDLHLRHRCALLALDAPHFMQIFLFNKRFSASGNRVIGYRLGVSRINILYLNFESKQTYYLKTIKVVKNNIKEHYNRRKYNNYLATFYYIGMGGA